MATYPPRRLLGARPLPSDPRRDPRRSDFALGGGRRRRAMLAGRTVRFPARRSTVRSAALPGSLPGVPPCVPPAAAGVRRCLVAVTESGGLRGLDRLPKPGRREPRPGVRARPRVQGRGVVRRRGSAHLGTRGVFVFVFSSDTPPPSTSCGLSPGPYYLPAP